MKFAYEFINLGGSIESAMKESSEVSGSINVKMIESFFLYRVEPFIKEFLKDNPMIKLKIGTGFQNDIVEVPSIEMIKRSVICGLGYGLVPRSAIKSEIESNKFNILPINIDNSLIHGIIVNKNRDLSNADKVFISTILNRFS